MSIFTQIISLVACFGFALGCSGPRTIRVTSLPARSASASLEVPGSAGLQPSAATMSQQAVVRSETCEACGKPIQVCQSFDPADYALIAAYIDALTADSQWTVFYRAPHGPTPAASSTWANDMPFDFLQKTMPSLRRETYESFLARNRLVAEHGISSFTTPAGHVVRIKRNPAKEDLCFYTTRGGFSADGKQALLSLEASTCLFELSDGRWKQVDSFIRWMQ